MRVIVLGSEGVIGKELVKVLKTKGHDVDEYDVKIDDSYDLSKNTFVWDEYDFVFFLAYDVGGSKYISDTGKSFIDNNVKIMLNTFTSLENSKTKRFVFASSQMQNMYNSYGTLKRLGEHYTQILDGISVRFWNIYGNEEVNNKSHVIPDFLHQYETTGKIKMLTDGTEERQFLHTEDCAECLVSIMDNYDTIKTERRIIDISSFEWITIYDLAKNITGSEDLVERGVVKSTLQQYKNEPDDYILKFWKPKIEGIKK